MNDELGKYQIIPVDDVLPKSVEIFFDREDAEGVYIHKIIQADEQEKKKYFDDPNDAHVYID